MGVVARVALPDDTQEIVVAVTATAILAFLAYGDGSTSGATPGKKLLGLRVIDATTGAALGWRRGLLRRAVYVLGGLPLYLGWIWVVTNPLRQAWHDKCARSLVVRTRA